MMEVAGLLIGIAGLAGLFSTCIEAIERISAFRHYSAEEHALNLQFAADRVDFKRWCERMGYRNGTFVDGYNNGLDDAQTRTLVEELLRSIIEMSETGETDGQAIKGTNEMEDGYELVRRASGLSNPGVWVKAEESASTGRRWPRLEERTRRRLAWALKGKYRFQTRVNLFHNLLVRLERLAPSADNLTRPNGLKPSSLGMEAELQKIFNESLKHSQRTARRELDSWIGIRWSKDAFEEFQGRIQPGTCEWILGREEFIDWARGSPSADMNSTLWINGAPSFGKSILCSRIVQFLRLQHQDRLAYYYFGATQGHDRQDPFVVAKSWVSQLTSQSQAALDAAQEWYGLEESLAGTASPKDILEILAKILAEVPGCILIVDGLDECDGGAQNNSPTERADKMSRFLHSCLALTQSADAKVLIVSRFDKDIDNALCQRDLAFHNNTTATQLKVTYSDIKHDARLVAEAILQRRLKRLKDDERSRLSNMKVERSGCMFMWIKMIGDQILPGTPVKKVEQIIKETPTGLTKLYDRNWQELTALGFHRGRALAILRWACFGWRPLTVAELVEALILEEQDEQLFEPNDYPDFIDEEYVNAQIIGLCASLIEVRRAPTICPRDGIVHLVHFSVREYTIGRLQDMPGSIKSSGSYDPARWPSNIPWQRRAVANQRNTLSILCSRYLISVKAWCPIETAAEKRNSLISQSHGRAVRSPSPLLDDNGAIKPTTLIADSRFLPSTCKTHETMTQHHQDILYNTCTVSRMSFAGYAMSSVGRGWFFGLETTQALIEVVTTLFADENIDWHIWGLQLQGQKRSHLPIGRLHYLANSNCVDVMRALFDRGVAPDVNALAPGPFTNNHGVTALHIACIRGYTETVKLLIEKGANVNIEDEVGCTPLERAIYKSRQDVIVLLLASGADRNFVDRYGQTPLHEAARMGNYEAVRLLLDVGDSGAATPDLHALTDRGHSCLHRAFWGGNRRIIQALIDAGSSIDVEPFEAINLLAWACLSAKLDCLQMFFDLGFDAVAGNFMTDRGAPYVDAATALFKIKPYSLSQLNVAYQLHRTFLVNHISMSEELGQVLRGIADRCVDESNCGLFLTSVKEGYDGAVRFLLHDGADVNQKDDKGWTPLMLAADRGYRDLCQTLIEAGALMEERIPDGRTALNIAVDGKHLLVCWELQKHGALVSPVNPPPKGLLAQAWRYIYGTYGLIEMLLDLGADVDERDSKGTTTLMSVSFRTGDVTFEIARLLLERGADPNAVDGRGMPVLFYVMQRTPEQDFLKWVTLLTHHGADLHKRNLAGHLAWLHAGCINDGHALKWAVTQGVVFNELDEGIVMAIAISTDQLGLVNTFLSLSGMGLKYPALGFCLNVTFSGSPRGFPTANEGSRQLKLTKRWWDPLELACLSGAVVIIQFLLEKRYFRPYSHRHGTSALYIAAQSGQIAAVRQLLESDHFDHELVDRQGYTAADRAAIHGHTAIVEILKDHGAMLNVGWGDLKWETILGLTSEEMKVMDLGEPLDQDVMGLQSLFALG